MSNGNLHFLYFSAIRHKENSQAYFYVSSNKVVGFLLAEFLGKSDKVNEATLNSKGDCILAPTKKGPKVGISRIWVAQDARRNGVATNLVKAMETNFCGPQILIKGQDYAFSHTTPDGTKFALKHTGKKYFLTYDNRQN